MDQELKFSVGDKVLIEVEIKEISENKIGKYLTLSNDEITFGYNTLKIRSDDQNIKGKRQ